MKNLFIISEEEKKRILGLHQSATKRQYLKEAMKKGEEFLAYFNDKNVIVDKAGTILRDANEEEYQQYRNDYKSFNVPTDTWNMMNTKKAATAPVLTGCEKYDISTNGKVQTATKSMKACDTQRQFKNTPCVTQKLSQRGVSNGGYVYYLFKGMRVYGKTETYPNKGGISKNSDTATIEQFFTCSDIEKYLPGFSKSGGVGDSLVSACPVGKGTTQEVTDFQNYVVNDVKDTTILGKYGPNKNGVDGKCGNSTRRAWTKYGESYNKYKGDENQGTDAVVPDGTSTQSKQSTPVNATRGISGMGQMYFDDLKNSGGNVTPAASSGDSTKPAASGDSTKPAASGGIVNAPIGKEEETDNYY